MAKQKLTANSDELSMSELFSGDYVFSIPYFQRSYKWKQDKAKELLKDLIHIVDEETDSHFLGALIYYTRKVGAGQPQIRELIDGQQRVTTVYLLICAIVKVAAENGLHEQAGSLFLSYLVSNKKSKLPSNLKLFSSGENRSQINRVISDLLADKDFAQEVEPFKFKPLPSAHKSNDGQAWKNYVAFRQEIEEIVEANGIEILEQIYESLFDSMSIVAIDVNDALNGPKIFDSLNSKQHPMTIGDLVRNEVFSRVSDEHPDEIESLEQNSWQPFYEKFRQGGKDLFDSYFFPYGIILNPSAKKSQIFNELRTTWAELDDPTEVIEELKEYQDAFLDLICGTNFQKHPANIFTLFRNLHRAGAPSSTLPFLMQLSNGLKNGEITTKTGSEILETIEAFLIRRAICGIEPTGLHAVFKKLWADCKGKPTRKLVTEKIRKHMTVAWPDDAQVKDAIKGRPLDRSNIVIYLIRAYNESLGGDVPVDRNQIEHVLPQTLNDSWKSIFTAEQHQQMKGLLGNLVPLSQPMNGSLSNKAYTEKRKRYESDSMFKATRKFADQFKKWGPAELTKRTATLAAWAIERWSY